MLRKVWHLLGLAFPVCYYLGVVSRETVLVAAGAATLILTVLEAVRFGHPWVARTFVAVFGGLLREEEKSLVNGSFIYLFAVFVAVLAFPKTLACVAVVYLAVGDAAAWLVGKHLGRVKIGRYKTLEGSLACFGARFLAVGAGGRRRRRGHRAVQPGPERQLHLAARRGRRRLVRFSDYPPPDNVIP
jgi:dolichol kinase